MDSYMAFVGGDMVRGVPAYMPHHKVTVSESGEEVDAGLTEILQAPFQCNLFFPRSWERRFGHTKLASMLEEFKRRIMALQSEFNTTPESFERV